jgi:hypothetical protein
MKGGGELDAMKAPLFNGALFFPVSFLIFCTAEWE